MTEAGQRRPDVELREDECSRPKRGEGKSGIGDRVEWQVVAEVHIQSEGERLGAGRKMGVRELHIRVVASEQLEDWSCLQTFANGGRVHPEQWPGRVALGGAPFLIPFANTAPRAQGAN